MKLIKNEWVGIRERVERWDDNARPVSIYEGGQRSSFLTEVLSLIGKKSLRRYYCVVAIDKLSQQVVGVGVLSKAKKEQRIVLKSAYEGDLFRSLVEGSLQRYLKK